MKLIKSIGFVIALSVAFSIQADMSSKPGLYDLSFTDSDNETVHLSEYKGRIVLLNFWATWCPPCVKEMPSMQRLSEHFAGQPFEVIAINIGESPTSVSSFLLELDTDLTFPILLDEEGRSYQTFGIRGLPMTLLLDQEGGLLLRTLGGKDWDSEASINLIEEAIKSVKG